MNEIIFVLRETDPFVYPVSLVFSLRATHPQVSLKRYCEFPLRISSSHEISSTSSSDYWRYFEPIRQNMPVNCSADVEAVITHIDQVFSGRDQKAINEIKDMFGLTVMTHLDDVAGARA